MRGRYILIVVVLLALSFGVGALSAAPGTPDSPAPPDDPLSASYTLEDIYKRLNDGTAGAQSTFTEPSSGPGTGTIHTLNQIMDKAPAADNTDGAVPAEVLTGKTYWSLRTDGSGGSSWGLETGTAAAGDNVSGPEGARTFTIPDGFYAGSKIATANDSDLAAGNIASGVEIFGVSGERHGGCVCTGVLNGTRWCDNEDGTVTDLTTCLVWLKKADWGGLWPWEDCENHDDVHSRVAALEAGAAGADLSDGSDPGDWRLPTLRELDGSTHGSEAVLASTPRAFTGVQWSHYWSSLAAELFAMAWDLDDAHIFYLLRSDSRWVWPVRGEQ